MTNITENLQLVRQRIAAAAAAAGRDPGSIRLLAVSKKHSAEAIREAYTAGQRDFGENYLQEARQKMERLADLAIRWHFIGALQSNKTSQVAHRFQWMHSLSRARIARRLSGQRPEGADPLQVCLQVRAGDEPGKSGIDESDLPELVQLVSELPGLRLRGLMCMPPWSEDPRTQRHYFARLRRLFENLRSAGYALDTLSMGMTGDLEAAVAEGSTCVRIGTAIFGPREE